MNLFGCFQDSYMFVFIRKSHLSTSQMLYYCFNLHLQCHQRYWAPFYGPVLFPSSWQKHPSSVPLYVSKRNCYFFVIKLKVYIFIYTLCKFLLHSKFSFVFYCSGLIFISKPPLQNQRASRNIILHTLQLRLLQSYFGNIFDNLFLSLSKYFQCRKIQRYASEAHLYHRDVFLGKEFSQKCGHFQRTLTTCTLQHGNERVFLHTESF